VKPVQKPHLEELESDRSIDDLEICSMIWFVITDEETDQTPQGKGTNLLAGTAGQITDTLKRYQEAGLRMPLLWPPFADVPVAKTLDDLQAAEGRDHAAGRRRVNRRSPSRNSEPEQPRRTRTRVLAAAPGP
jgi:hypothetical protein